MTTPLASVIALCTLACGSAQPGRRSTDTALVAPALVACKRDAADAWYTVGTLTFESADYEQAVYAFKRAFTAEIDDARKPKYLLQISEAYRQLRKCGEALFFYKRYLGLLNVEPLDEASRKRVEELGECARSEDAQHGPHF